MWNAYRVSSPSKLRLRRKHIVLAACLLLPNTAIAEEIYIHLGGWSKHIGNGNFNSNHKLIAVEYKSAIAAKFENSYYRESYAVGVGKHKKYGYHDLSGFIGAVRGYTTCYGEDGSNNNLCPMVVGMYHYTRYPIQPGVVWLGDAIAATIRTEW